MSFDVFWLEVIRAVAWPVAVFCCVKLFLAAVAKENSDE